MYTILEIFAISQSNVSNSHAKLGKIDLLINLVCQIENWLPHEVFTSYLSSKEETTDVNILNDDAMIPNGAPKLEILRLRHLAHHRASAFDFHE